MAVAANLDISLGTNSTRLDKGLKKSRRRTKKFSRGVSKDFKAIASSLAAAFSVRAFGSALDNLDKLGKTITGLGVGAETYQLLTQSLQEYGISADTTGNTLKKLQANLGAASQGLSTQIKALDALGLSYSEIQNLKIDEIFDVIIKRLRTVTDTNLRARAAQDLLGRGYKDLLPLINGTADAYDAVSARNKELGAFITQKQLDNVQEFNDDIGRTGTILKVIGVDILTSLFGKDSSKEIKKFNKYLSDNRELIIKALKAIVLIGGAFAGWKLAVGIISLITAQLAILIAVLARASSAVLVFDTKLFAKTGFVAVSQSIKILGKSALTLGSIFVSKLRPSLKVVGFGAVGATNLFKLMGIALRNLAKTLLPLVAIGEVIYIIYKVSTQGIKAVSGLEIAMLGLLGAVTIAFAPIIGIPVLIAAVGLAIYKYWDKIENFIKPATDAVGNFFSSIRDGIKDYFANNDVGLFEEALRGLFGYIDKIANGNADLEPIELFNIAKLKEFTDAETEAANARAEAIAADAVLAENNLAIGKELLESKGIYVGKIIEAQNAERDYNAQLVIGNNLLKSRNIDVAALLAEQAADLERKQLEATNLTDFPQGYDPSQGGPNPFAVLSDSKLDLGVEIEDRDVDLSKYVSIGEQIKGGILEGLSGTSTAITESISQYSDNFVKDQALTTKQVASNSIKAIGDLAAAGSKQSKTAFKANKAFQIANTLIDTSNAVVKGLASPFPLNLILPALALVQGQAQLRQIKATTFNPPRRFGGDVAAGRPGLVGENGAEYFTPKVDGTIIPNPKDGGGFGGTSLYGNITVNAGAGSDPADVADTISDQFANKFDNRDDELGAGNEYSPYRYA